MTDGLKRGRLYSEAGAYYARDLETARAHGFARMVYQWAHTSGAAGTSEVYCNPGDLLRLIDRWNGQRSAFRYWYGR